MRCCTLVLLIILALPSRTVSSGRDAVHESPAVNSAVTGICAERPFREERPLETERLVCAERLWSPAPHQWDRRAERCPAGVSSRVAGGDTDWLTSAWLFLRRFLLPKELNLIYELRAWIGALTPPDERTRAGDLRRTDEIYRRAVYLAEGDPALAMLGCAWATLPYHTFPARIPLLNVGITVPVSTERREAFERRMANLPGLLFPDSRTWLDRDKLPHFFGSAWLQLVSHRPGLALFAGEALEWAESVFKLEGSRDPRDIAVNRLGVCFARALQDRRDVLPSDFLNLGLQSHDCKHDTQDPAR